MRTASFFDNEQRKTFGQLGRSLDKVLKTPELKQAGRQVYEDDVLLFVHPRD